MARRRYLSRIIGRRALGSVPGKGRSFRTALVRHSHDPISPAAALSGGHQSVEEGGDTGGAATRSQSSAPLNVPVGPAGTPMELPANGTGFAKPALGTALAEGPAAERTGEGATATPDPEGSSPCPVCGCRDFVTLVRGSDRLYRTTAKIFSVVECGRCKLLRLYPPPTPPELSGYYPKDYWFAPAESTRDRMVESYRRVVLGDHVRFVRRAMAQAPKEGLLLDVGCGGGLFLRMMAEHGYRVAGLDFSLDAASAAWQTNGVPTTCAALSSAPFAPNSCSAITMFHVLEHLYDPAEYIQTARSLLRQDGRLIVQVPNAACWQFMLLGEKWNGVDIPRHLFDFRPADLELMLDRCGFQVVRRKHFSLRDNPAGFATSLAPWLDPMSRHVLGVPERPRLRLFKDSLYFGLVLACLPFAVFEAACRAGSTIMLEARKKP